MCGYCIESITLSLWETGTFSVSQLSDADKQMFQEQILLEANDLQSCRSLATTPLSNTLLTMRCLENHIRGQSRLITISTLPLLDMRSPWPGLSGIWDHLAVQRADFHLQVSSDLLEEAEACCQYALSFYEPLRSTGLPIATDTGSNRLDTDQDSPDWEEKEATFSGYFPNFWIAMTLLEIYRPDSQVIIDIAQSVYAQPPGFSAFELALQRKAIAHIYEYYGFDYLMKTLHHYRLELLIYLGLRCMDCTGQMEAEQQLLDALHGDEFVGANMSTAMAREMLVEVFNNRSSNHFVS